MQQPKTLKGFTSFVDGFGFLGRVLSGDPPKIAIKVESFRDGGMDIPVDLDMGMEALKFGVSFAEYDPVIYSRIGIIGRNIPLVFRGSLEDEAGVSIPIVHTARGLVQELDPGTAEPGKPGSLKLQLSPRFYQLTINGQEQIYIDPYNAVRRIGGVDQLQTRRQNLGL